MISGVPPQPDVLHDIFCRDGTSGMRYAMLNRRERLPMKVETFVCVLIHDIRYKAASRVSRRQQSGDPCVA
jgi:hypothetical protein